MKFTGTISRCSCFSSGYRWGFDREFAEQMMTLQQKLEEPPFSGGVQTTAVANAIPLRDSSIRLPQLE
jgi:hypothetical protein